MVGVGCWYRWKGTQGKILEGLVQGTVERTLQGRRAGGEWDGLRHHFCCILIKMSLAAAANHSANRMPAAKKGC